MDPGSFAMVMATGIVSTAAFSSGLVPLAWGLFQLNKVVYVALWALTAVRLIAFRPAVVEDLTHRLRGPGFLTVPAATCVLGSQFVLLAGDATTGWGLWLLGIALWALLIYTFLTVMATQGAKPPLERALSGGWLIVVVATQSVSVLGTLVASHTGAWQHVTLFFALAMYLLGGMLYVPLIGLILYRLLFARLVPEALTPSYWINMGALAISTLAGALLIAHRASWSLLEDIHPFLAGATLALWAMSTWWIPLLVILGIWRHVARRVGLAYDPEYWTLVFPLGMYATCTFALAGDLHVMFLLPIARLFTYFGIAAWCVTFIGLLGAGGPGRLRTTR